MSNKNRGLGRGLEGPHGQTTQRPMPGVAPTRDQVAYLPVDLLFENIQREKLNPLEEALAFSRLSTQCEPTRQQAAMALAAAAQETWTFAG